MKFDDKQKLINLYEDRYDQFGYDVKSIGWGNIESQQLRFRILAEIADLSNCRICDFGCGFGDLYLYLTERFTNIDYVGIDLSVKLIEEAKRRYPQAAFEVRDILENPLKKKFDYMLASGTLSFKLKNHEKYVEKILTAMIKASKKGVGVNFLSSYVDYELEKNFHFSPEKAFTLAKKLTKYVTIRHDYPLYEFTLYLYQSCPIEKHVENKLAK